MLLSGQFSKYHSSSPLLDSLHWLPIDKRIQFKVLLYIYKALNDLSPVYLQDCITIYVPSREGLRSSADNARLIIPRSRGRIGDSSFSVFGPTKWNQLPHTLRTAPTVQSFKQGLKTYLY